MFKKLFCYTFIVIIGLFFSTFLYASEEKVGLDKRKELSVAIYNTNLALVKDKRKVSLVSGVNDLAFIDVSAQIRPETALLQGKGIKVLEQNFNFDLLSPESLLLKYLGKEIEVISTNPATGVEKLEKATVLSTEGGIVLRIGDRIETGFVGRYIFPDIPDNLRDRPTLVLKLYSSKKENTDIELGYLTGGLSWQADYVAELDSGEKFLRLNGWVTLTNTSGVSYDDALVQLVAGSVNVVEPQVRGMYMAKNVALAESSATDMIGGAKEESFMDYHLYTLRDKTSILSNQTKQVSLFSTPQVLVNKEYRLDNPFMVYKNLKAREYERRNPVVFIKFNNKEGSGLGIPLPSGIFRVYKEDNSGQLLFVGEDSIKHTPKNEEVKIKLGEAFDIIVQGKAIDYRQLSDKSYEASFEVLLKNAKDSDVEVNIYQNFPNGWKIISENIKSIKENANQVLWKIKVPKAGESKLQVKIFVAN